jgi:heme oxygenase
MDNLKEITHQQHKNAETQPFVKVLFSGKMDPELYAIYLYNQFPMYEILEVTAMPHGILNNVPHLLRSKSIWADFEELWPTDKKDPPPTLPVVKKYMDHIMSIKDDPKKLMAHIYVRHMGDLSGGQMIAKRIPGSGKYYQFDNPDELKQLVRAKLDDSMADEAKICFDFATEFFKQMMGLVK